MFIVNVKIRVVRELQYQVTITSTYKKAHVVGFLTLNVDEWAAFLHACEAAHFEVRFDANETISPEVAGPAPR